MKSKYKIRGLTDESNMALNKSVMTHVRKVLGVPQNVYTTFNTSLSDVHLAIHKTSRNSTSQYITVQDAEKIKEFDKEYIDARDYTVTDPVFDDPTYIKIESYGGKVKRTCTIEFRSGEKKEINNILENIDNVISRGVLEVEYKLDNNIVNFLNHVRETKNTLALAKDDQEMDVYLPEDKKSVKRFATYDLKIISREPVTYVENEWILQAKIEVVYNRDLLLLIDHNILFNNSTLSDKFMKAVGRFSDKSNRHIVKELGDGYTTYLVDQDLNYNVPITDNFVPPVQNEKYVALATIVLPIDNERDFLANIHGIPGLYIPEKYINFMLAKREMLLSDYKSVFILELYEDDKLLQNVLRIDEDGNLYGVRSLDLNKVYRLVIRRARDASMLNQEEFNRTKEAIGLDFQNMIIYLNDNDEEEFDLNGSHRAWLDTFITQHTPFTLEPFVEKPLPINYNTGELPLVLSDIVENEWTIKKPVITSEGYTEWSNFNGILTGGGYEVTGRYPGDFYRAEWKFASSGLGGTPNLEDPSIVPTELPVNNINVINLEIFKPLTKVHAKVRYSSDYADKPLKSEWSEPFEVIVPAIGVQPIEVTPEKKNEKLYVKTKIVSVTKENEAITGPVTKGPAKLTITDEDGKVVREVTVPTNREELTTLIALNGYKPGKYKIKVKQELENEWLKARNANVVETETEVDLTIDDIPFEVNDDWGIEKPTITSAGFNSNAPASTFDNFSGILNVSEYVDTHDYPGEYSSTEFRMVATDSGSTPNFLAGTPVKEENDTRVWNIKDVLALRPNSTVWVQARNKSNFRKHPMESDWSDTFIINVPKMGIKPIEITTELQTPYLVIKAPVELLEDNPNNFIGALTLGTTKVRLLRGAAVYKEAEWIAGEAKIHLNDIDENKEYTIEVTHTVNNDWLKARNADVFTFTKKYLLETKPFIVNPLWSIETPTISETTYDPANFSRFQGIINVSNYKDTNDYPGDFDGIKVAILALDKTALAPTTLDENTPNVVIKEATENSFNLFYPEMKQNIDLTKTYYVAVKHVSKFTKHPMESGWSNILAFPMKEPKIDAEIKTEVVGRNLTLSAETKYENVNEHISGPVNSGTFEYTLKNKATGTPVTLRDSGNNKIANIDTDLEPNTDYTVEVTYKEDNAWYKARNIDTVSKTATWNMGNRPWNTAWKITTPTLSLDGSTQDTFTGKLVASAYAAEGGFTGTQDGYEIILTQATSLTTPEDPTTWENRVEMSSGLDSDKKLNYMDTLEDNHLGFFTATKAAIRYYSNVTNPSGNKLYSEWGILDINLPAPEEELIIASKVVNTDTRELTITAKITHKNFYRQFMGDPDDHTVAFTMRREDGPPIPEPLVVNGLVAKISTDNINEGSEYSITVAYKSNNLWIRKVGEDEKTVEDTWSLASKPWNENWKIAKPTISLSPGVGYPKLFSNGSLELSEYTAEGGYPGTRGGIELDIVHQASSLPAPTNDWTTNAIVDLDNIRQSYIEYNKHIAIFKWIEDAAPTNLQLKDTTIYYRFRYYGTYNHPTDGRFYSPWSDTYTMPMVNPNLTCEVSALTPKTDDPFTIEFNIHTKNDDPYTGKLHFSEYVAYRTDTIMRKKDDHSVTVPVTNTDQKLQDHDIIHKHTFSLNDIDVQTDYEIVTTLDIKETDRFGKWLGRFGYTDREIITPYRIEEKPFVVNPLWKINKPTLSMKNLDPNDPDTFLLADGKIKGSEYSVEAAYPGSLNQVVLTIKSGDAADSLDKTDIINLNITSGTNFTSSIQDVAYDSIVEQNKYYSVTAKYKSTFDKHPLESEESEPLKFHIQNFGIQEVDGTVGIEQDKIKANFPTFTLYPMSSELIDTSADKLFRTVTISPENTPDQSTDIISRVANTQTGEISINYLTYGDNYKVKFIGEIENEWLRRRGWNRKVKEVAFSAAKHPTWTVKQPTIAWKDYQEGTDEFANFPGILTISAYGTEGGYTGTEEDATWEIKDIVYRDPQPGQTGRRNLITANITGTLPAGTTEFNILENENVKNLLDWGMSFKIYVQHHGKATIDTKDHKVDSAASEGLLLTVPEDLGKTTINLELTNDNARGVVIKSTATTKTHTLIGDISNTTLTATVTKNDTIVKDKVAITGSELVIPFSELEKNTKYNVAVNYTIDNEWLKARLRDKTSTNDFITTPKVQIPLGPDGKPIVPVEHEIPGGTGTVHIAPFKVGLDMNEFTFDPTEFKFIRKD